MFFASEREALTLARKEASEIFDRTGAKPKVLSAQNLSTFWGGLGYSFKLIFAEKEIVFFAASQWLVIGLAYGAVGLLSGFCLLSSLRGWWASGDSRLIRTYALALGVAIAAAQLLDCDAALPRTCALPFGPFGARTHRRRT